MTVIAPGTSKIRCSASALDSGTNLSESRKAAMPTGTLTKKIHGHEKYSVSTPPRSRPIAAPPVAIACPDAHRLRALRSLGEGRRQDRERRRRDEGGAEALQAACHDQHSSRVREPVQERGDREDDHADEEYPLAPEDVAGAATEQQEAAEGQRVGVHDPLQVGLGHVQVGLDRRQRHVHDRRVEDDHELRQADEAEDEPGIRLAAGHHSLLSNAAWATVRSW